MCSSRDKELQRASPRPSVEARSPTTLGSSRSEDCLSLHHPEPAWRPVRTMAARSDHLRSLLCSSLSVPLNSGPPATSIATRLLVLEQRQDEAVATVAEVFRPDA